ncbi:MAG: glycosyltransferase family 2 protein [Phenylobacterium sp.]|uniref:glycosyltransferase family 2 protein n=1 Tax=Phenylobacterium sp. TaxID=1871053 RepID=UPI0025DB3664|nr:glycosyltransferase family 2 protein [Phenylobacterium sp.]MCA3708859.1 glycosyltransferase family 2 protein [Phenylobacterium sp.]MCA3728011.1 glycosyltransferase family 2 protein [Phenylobacterium sp.]MCA3735012.1 glycosyltransferase family 2 protein [Phenylobacterium sp.]MCA3757510.1 glycosyltransferase family 2 protein [Phenylobacterium sp.]MCA6229399.1 glycosyltransferase family 2 protein [Phenylobacterium sp.]
MTATATATRSRRGARLSLVIPMHNEAEVLPTTLAAVHAALDGLGLEYEIIGVDDGSTDETFAVLSRLAEADPRLRGLRLSRNFGKEAALSAGLDHCDGDMVVPIDADLQDPPSLIADFITLWEAGYDVVYGVRTERRSDTFFKRATAGVFYRVFNRISDVPIPGDTGDFRLMDRAVVEALRALPERNRFMKGLFAWVGFRQVGVPYARPERAAGTTSFNGPRLFRFALDGITAFSTAPLRVWSLVGLAGAAAALGYALFLIVHVLVRGRDIPGYASLMVVLLLFSSFQMIALGVFGEYLGRMYQEIKGRPLYIISDRVGV